MRRLGRAASLCLFLLLAVPVALSTCPSSLRGEEERPTDRLVILYTGETHGNVEPCG
ncbi:MAG: hypothetical protein QHH30_08600 [candidate division NC10 bacterium]|nr:hypothetical protein [candidate division NC10 bacterium]